MAASVRLPVEGVPDLRSFQRHLWRYRDEAGSSPLLRPPSWIYHYRIEDDGSDGELSMLRALVHTLRESYAFLERVRVAKFSGAYVVHFADIEVLHAFLMLLLAKNTVQGDEVILFVLGSLGFDWRSR